ncbi:LOW QUALITY PROTEIN: hypothetical protein OSB04_011912 [Centaurea solstitialis]|uniref:Uncharacterized protein n=1 Tax=Centaurea solstitialis TaxID=347529 RepID=A0AA38THY1_9ASTR|nr:LOW QUALITY PROTEIN: hypothetical protein OSB04_011912 [Centaurea solstitialis]
MSFHYEIQYRSGQKNVIAYSLSRVSRSTILCTSIVSFDLTNIVKASYQRNGKIVVGLDENIIFKLIQWYHFSMKNERPDKGCEVVRQFVKECQVCQALKDDTTTSPGLLQQLPIPKEAWMDISVYFVTGLPKIFGKEVIDATVRQLMIEHQQDDSGDALPRDREAVASRREALATPRVVNKPNEHERRLVRVRSFNLTEQTNEHERIFQLGLTFISRYRMDFSRRQVGIMKEGSRKYAYFIALSHPFIIVQVAQAYLDNLLELHGWPRSILSDSDLVFLNQFWKRLIFFHDMEFMLSLAYQSKTNEVANRCLETNLRCMCEFNLKLTHFEVVYSQPPLVLLSYLLGESSMDTVHKSFQRREAMKTRPNRVLQDRDRVWLKPSLIDKHLSIIEMIESCHISILVLFKFYQLLGKWLIS